MYEIPCVIVRGGTSKGIYLRQDDLPEKIEHRDEIISRLFGSPDPRQINGLGGADPLTSKVAILSTTNRDDSDVTYLSGEVRLGCFDINYGIMCGNLASGVGLAAHHLKLLDTFPNDNVVRIYNANSDSVIHAEYQDFARGVSGADNEVKLTFFASGGGATAKILPTDAPVDVISLPGRDIECSIVDAGAIYVFIRSDVFGLSGNESPEHLNANGEMRQTVEKIRREACMRINHLNPHLSIQVGQIKVALASEPLARDESADNAHPADIEARIINPQGVHRAYAVSGAICCCTASAIEGTIVNQITSTHTDSPSMVIGHPEGALCISVELQRNSTGISIKKSNILRSARIIMSGMAYVES